MRVMGCFANYEQMPVSGLPTSIARQSLGYFTGFGASMRTIRHVVVCSHFVDYVSNCDDDGVWRLRHAVVRVHHDLPSMR